MINQEKNINHPKIKILRNLQDKKFISSLQDKTSQQKNMLLKFLRLLNDLKKITKKEKKLKQFIDLIILQV